MQGSQNHIIHIYGFDETLSLTDQEFADNLRKALQNYLQVVPEIKIRGKSNRLWGYISVDTAQAEKLNKLKKINVNGFDALIGQYYHDHQIFMNKLDKSANADQIKEYFSKFGKVLDVVVRSPENVTDSNIRHCYIKMENEQVVDQVIMMKNHKIEDEYFKVVRTFKLDEDKTSDKKLILIVQGNIALPETFQEKAIKYFLSYGALRERPKLQNLSTNKSKIIITYTHPKYATAALAEFNKSEWVRQSKEVSLSMKLNYFISKESKIFVRGLKQTTQNCVSDAFQVFGEIQDVILMKNQGRPGMNAIIGFFDEMAYKKALSLYDEEQSIRHLFIHKPYVTIYMTPQIKRSYYSMKNAQKLQGSKPFIPMHSQNIPMMPNKIPPNMMPPPLMAPMPPMQPPSKPKHINPQ